MLLASVTRTGRFVRMSSAPQGSFEPVAGARIPLTGVVTRGDGVACRFTSLDWLVEEFRMKLGFVPHPGTLNLHMSGPRWRAARQRLAAASGIAITSPTGFCGARCFRVRLAGRIDGALVLPDVAHYPSHKFEIVAPVPVRATLGLGDGDRVALRLELTCSTVPLRVGASGDARTASRTEIARLVGGERS
ncbi:CTP-dependent riboflavin kinase [Azoarcus sp. PA01]|nr:CTP-dependent riboflavin kinase [Azoarcus sp. PA01]